MIGLADHQHVGYPVCKLFDSIQELKGWTQLSAPWETGDHSPLSPKDIAGLSDPELRRAIENHAFGIEELSPEAANAVNARFNSFVAFAAAAPDITVTAAKPLIINNSGIATVYGTVTIDSGGYIEITTTCSFSCDQMVKVSGNAASGQPADIIIHAADGAPGAPGVKADDGHDGGAGNNKQCDCCGGEVAHSATAGGNGTDGGDSTTGQTGKNGRSPINVQMDLGKITGSVTLLSRGANGGQGGDGAHGGNGGNGGNGGDGGSCGAYHPSGKNGGTAGNGGAGGNNGSGGDAANGSNVTVVFDTGSTGAGGSLTPQNSGGEGGPKGQVGPGGAAGKPGQGGSDGGTSGAGGKQGVPGNDVASPGQSSNPGALTVNGRPV